MKPVPGPGLGVPLEDLFPRRFPGWQTDMGAEVFVRPSRERGREHGIYDQVLERTYVSADGAGLMLLAAQGNEQSAGLQMHRPEVCYPSNGFRLSSFETVSLQVVGRALPGARLHAVRSGRAESVTYWMVLGEQVVAGSTEFRLRQLQFGLRRKLLDGMLVRLSSIGPDAQRGYTLHARFASDLATALPAGNRAKIMGA